MINIIRSVNFGSRKAGLSTIGLTIYDSSGNIVAARTTTGIVEIGLTGIYQSPLSIGDTFIGLILWDTGDRVKTPIKVGRE